MKKKEKIDDWDRRCENCVDGQSISSFFVYCSKNRKKMYAFTVCEDHRTVEEVFDLTSDTPFTDWVKKERKRSEKVEREEGGRQKTSRAFTLSFSCLPLLLQN